MIKKIKISPNFFQGRAPKFTQALQPRSRNDLPAQTAQTTATPDIKNTTVTPNVTKGRQTRRGTVTSWVSCLQLRISSFLTFPVILQLLQEKINKYELLCLGKSSHVPRSVLWYV